MRKYKRLRRRRAGRAGSWLTSPDASPTCSPTGASACALTAGRWEPDERRGSRPVLRAPGGAIPPATLLVALRHSRADRGSPRAGRGGAGSVGLRLHPEKPRIVHLALVPRGSNFRASTIAWGKSWRTGHWYLQKWPSKRAMAQVRPRSVTGWTPVTRGCRWNGRSRISTARLRGRWEAPRTSRQSRAVPGRSRQSADIARISPRSVDRRVQRPVLATRLDVASTRAVAAPPAVALPVSDKSGSRERRLRAVAARAEEPLADRRSCIPASAQNCRSCGLSVGLFCSIRRVAEVRLDRRRRAAEASGDLGDREALGLADVARQGNGAAAIEHNGHTPRVRCTTCSLGIAWSAGCPEPSHPVNG